MKSFRFEVILGKASRMCERTVFGKICQWYSLLSLLGAGSEHYYYFPGSTPISAVQFTTLPRTEGRYQLPRISMLVSLMCPQDKSEYCSSV